MQKTRSRRCRTSGVVERSPVPSPFLPHTPIVLPCIPTHSPLGVGPRLHQLPTSVVLMIVLCGAGHFPSCPASSIPSFPPPSWRGKPSAAQYWDGDGKLHGCDSLLGGQEESHTVNMYSFPLSCLTATAEQFKCSLKWILYTRL